MGFSLDQVFQTLFTQFGSSFLFLKFALLLALAFQVSIRDEYDYPKDYVTQTFPWSFRPFSNVPILSLVRLPDNACKRSIFGSPIICDYIVVGSGASGAVVANRLSDNSSNTVCLIEAGGDSSTESIIPQLHPFAKAVNIWPYYAEISNKSSMAFEKGSSCIFGKQLGGTTALNAMVYLCGIPWDFDHWAELVNDTDWGYDALQPYFEKSRNELGVSYNIRDPFTPALEAAFKEVGYGSYNYFNTRGNNNGFFRVQSTIKNGERSSSYLAFIAPVKKRENLKIFKHSHVTHVVFDKKKAVGVNIRTKHAACPNIEVIARKEVILCAGTFGTTKIMLQSGIGRKDDLKQHGINQTADLNVGNNYCDHVYAIPWISVNPNASSQNYFDLFLDSFQYITTRTGPMSSLGTAYTEGMIDSLNVTGIYPDIQMTFYRYEKTQVYFKQILENYEYSKPYIRKIMEINEKKQVMMIYVTVLRPLSKGTVKLRSKDPLDHPIIKTNAFQQEADVDTIVSGLLRLVELMNTKPMKDANASFIEFDIPECKQYAFLSRSYWICFIKYVTSTYWHSSGTCKMGNTTDTNAVVDTKLKVVGIDNLRICDASVFPSQPSSNTQCIAYMVGEKCADFIINNT